MSVETSFGRWLQHRRKALDLTQEELAQRLGYSAETIRKIEAGVRHPSRQMAERLTEVLEIPESDRAVFIKAARAELLVDRLKPPTQDLPQATLVPAKALSSEAVSFLFTQITPAYEAQPFDGRCPYKGLDVFEEEDAELFFGRERLVEDLLRRLKESRTVFIIGPSGSGKSSLVRAGLIPALKQGAMKNLHSERWLFETMKPGREPIDELARVISSMAGTVKAGDEIRENAPMNVKIFSQWCEIALKEGRNKRAVLFIDQFEEIFTQVPHEEERLAFLNLLTQAATAKNGRVIVLFAMRSDFVMNCATYPKLNALFNRQSIQIGAMEPHELANAIARPALSVGLRIDRDLVEQIINEMRGEPGALPLMQFALKDLFDSQQAKGGTIALTLTDYLQHGGIHKSLERHADESFARLKDNEQEVARAIFSGLIEIGRGRHDTRRTALLEELIPSDSKAADVKIVIEKLADARLITTDEQAGKDTVTISHEKLIDAWPWLKRLVDENRETIALQNEIVNDAKEWDDHQRDPSYLYRGARLANIREQLEAKKLLLSGTAREFIETGATTYINELEEARKTTNRLLQLTEVVLARQLAAQAQSIVATKGSKQMIAVLLAVQSMKIFPSSEAAQIILNHNFAARLIARMTHDDFISSLAFSPDGKYVVSGSYDRTARVWSVSTGKEVAHITHDHWVNCVAFSPDSKYVISGSEDKTARVWKASTGQEVARSTHHNWINSVAFCPDGKHVASGSWGIARVWEAATGQEIARTPPDHWANALVFSPDGKYVVSGGFKNARVWEAATGKELARMTHNSAVGSLAFSPDGKYVVSGGSKNARVWEAATGKEIARMTHDDIISSVAFSPDGQFVVSGSWVGIARVWEAATGKEIARMVHNAAVVSLSFSPDGRYVASGGDVTARVWDATTGQEFARMTHDDIVSSVAFSPDGKYVVSGSWDNTIRVWEVRIAPEVARVSHAGSVRSIAFSPDGKYVASGSEDKTTKVWEATTGEEAARMTHEDAVSSIAFSPDGKYVALGSPDGTAHVWDVRTAQEVARVSHTGNVQCIAFSPDGKYVISGSEDKTARVWDAITGEEIARATHDNCLSSLAFSPDGKYVVSGSEDKTARVWDAATGEEVARMTHEDTVSSAVFSPDGKYIVSGSEDKTARVWDAITGKEIARMVHDAAVVSLAFSPDGKHVVSGSDITARVWDAATGKKVSRMIHDDEYVGHFSREGELVRIIHDAWVTSLAFSPDGKYVVSGSKDHTARVWEASTGNEVARLIHGDTVSSVAFSPDGKYIVSGSEDKTLRIWMWRPEDLISNACAYLPRNLTRAEWKQYIGDALPYQAVCPNLPIEPEATPDTPSAPHP